MRGSTREAPAEMAKRMQFRMELRMLPMPPTLSLQVKTRSGVQVVLAQMLRRASESRGGVSKTSSTKGAVGLGVVREKREGLKPTKSQIAMRSQRARAACFRLVPCGSWIIAAGWGHQNRWQLMSWRE